MFVGNISTILYNMRKGKIAIVNFLDGHSILNIIDGF
jgi:hypothetical protein